ncbi:hypothetical protein [Microbacterium sp. NPDC058389]|uniref:hypothetical protein n=1 Tax=Microbacterium sp. NPDC058389 TaxID=3346475 RepID=UPI00365FBDBF
MNSTDRDEGRDESRMDALKGTSGGAMPMPHGSDATAPLPPEDGALPMPHGTDSEIPEWSDTQHDDDDEDDDA